MEPPRFGGPVGGVAEWLKAADCKSARASVHWFESSPLHQPPDRGYDRRHRRIETPALPGESGEQRLRTARDPRTATIVASATILALIGFLTRFALRNVETRWQILSFWLIAGVVAYALPARPVRLGWATLAAAATVAIIAAKWVVEGKILRH